MQLRCKSGSDIPSHITHASTFFSTGCRCFLFFLLPLPVLLLLRKIYSFLTMSFIFLLRCVPRRIDPRPHFVPLDSLSASIFQFSTLNSLEPAGIGEISVARLPSAALSRLRGRGAFLSIHYSIQINFRIIESVEPLLTQASRRGQIRIQGDINPDAIEMRPDTFDHRADVKFPRPRYAQEGARRARIHFCQG